MAFDTYMYIDQPGGGTKIEGESTAKGLDPATGWFELMSFSWGASNPVTVGPSSGGISGGMVSISSFNVMKKSDKSSPLLLLASCNNEHFGSVKVVCRKGTGGSGGQQAFLKYTFTDCMVESIQWSGSGGGDDTPTESLSLAFAQCQIETFLQNTQTGQMTAGPQMSWDQTQVAS